MPKIVEQRLSSVCFSDRGFFLILDDFRWRLSWVSKLEALHASLPACNGFFRFTSGATAANLLMASIAFELFRSMYTNRHCWDPNSGRTVWHSVCVLTVWATTARPLWQRLDPTVIFMTQSTCWKLQESSFKRLSSNYNFFVKKY